VSRTRTALPCAGSAEAGTRSTLTQCGPGGSRRCAASGHGQIQQDSMGVGSGNMAVQSDVMEAADLTIAAKRSALQMRRRHLLLDPRSCAISVLLILGGIIVS